MSTRGITLATLILISLLTSSISAQTFRGGNLPTSQKGRTIQSMRSPRKSSEVRQQTSKVTDRWANDRSSDNKRQTSAASKASSTSRSMRSQGSVSRVVAAKPVSTKAQQSMPSVSRRKTAESSPSTMSRATSSSEVVRQANSRMRASSRTTGSTPQLGLNNGNLPVSLSSKNLARTAATQNASIAISRVSELGVRATVDATVDAHGDVSSEGVKRERVERVLQIVGSLVRSARQQSAQAGIDSFADSADYDVTVDAYYPEEASVRESCGTPDLAASAQYSAGYEDTEYIETPDPSVGALPETANEVDGDQPPGNESVEAKGGPEVPIGSTLTLTLELPEVEGVILLKTGPLVIRLFPTTWTTESAEMTLPDFCLMRNATAAIYVLDQGGQLLSSQVLTLVPADTKTKSE